MGIQGNKATTREHDFLSLYTTAAKDPSLQLHDAKPPSPSQGFFLRTHDFLQPLEKPTPAPAPPPTSQQQQQAFPGGIGTFSISHVAGARPVAAAVVKAEPTPFVLWGQPAAAAAAAAHPVAALGHHHHHHHQWTLPFAGVGQVAATAARQQQQERKGRVGGGGFMDSGSRSSGGAGFDDDDGVAARREVSSSLKERRREGRGEEGRRRSRGLMEMEMEMEMYSRCARPSHIHQLHARLVVSGRLRCSSPSLALLRAACRVRASPCLRPLVHHLLDHVPRPHPHLLHAAARLAYRLRLPSLALRHFVALRTHHPAFLPPAAAIADMLKSVRGRAAHAHALRVTAHAGDTRFLDNTLIAMYFACGDIQRARLVFEGMRDRDVISWTSLISGLVQNGSPLQGIQQFATMMHCDVRPDFVVLVTIAKAFMELDNLPGAESAHSLVVKGGFHDEQDVMITLTAMYASFGCLVAARALFDMVPPQQVNVILWNAMISGYSKNGFASEAVHLFKHMQLVARNLAPDSITLRSVIFACAQLGSTELVAWMEDCVCRSEYREDVLVNTALIDMYAKSGSISHARAVFERMHVDDRDVVVWSALITGYGVQGLVNEACTLFQDMKLAGVRPNDVTFLGLLSACNHAGAVEKGWSYFHSMKPDYGIEPQHQHYACMVDLLSRAGQLDRAYQFILNMPIKPEMTVWGALLHGCKMHGHSNMAMAECAAQHIFELEQSNAGHYVQLANMYASAGMWSQVAGMRVTMRERGVTKVTGCSFIEVDGEMHSFHAWDHSHPRATEIFAMLCLLSPTPAGGEMRVDGKGGSCSGSGTDQRPSSPRSKHSATEQRRRSKINDRFQILRELLPHSDQKRDKATFLLEVIEYIRFLQEKVQKFEASVPEWNQENAKILPWSKGQNPGDDLPDPSQFIRNGSSSGYNFTGKPDDNHNMVTSAAASGAAELVETDRAASVSYRSAETPTNITNNVTSQAQAQWASPAGVDDCAMNSEMLNNQQLAIDEGTISLSSQYSQQLLGTLTHALESSGVDLSQASISVQINLGKRAVKRPGADGSSSSKELPSTSANNENMGHQLTMLGGGTEELPHPTKRHKSGNS
uniref:BHLH domain-containing protein n=1 Tax=Oryza meridionalis TaxID=40149 RepID=A0A0E0ET42_9ORYZ